MTLKSKIASVLSKQSEYRWFYGSAKGTNVPYIRYSLGDNHSERLSNKKAIRNIWYQVDVFSYHPIDIEASGTILEKIEQALEEKRLITTDWIENISFDNSKRTTIYHYFIEVRA